MTFRLQISTDRVPVIVILPILAYTVSIFEAVFGVETIFGPSIKLIKFSITIHDTPISVYPVSLSKTTNIAWSRHDPETRIIDRQTPITFIYLPTSMVRIAFQHTTEWIRGTCPSPLETYLFVGTIGPFLPLFGIFVQWIAKELDVYSNIMWTNKLLFAAIPTHVVRPLTPF